MEWFLALAADDFGVHVVVAGGVVQDQRRAFRTGQPAVTPCGHRREDGVHLSTLVGESIFVTLPAFVVGHPGQHAFFDDAVEPLGQDVPADAERCLKVVEPASAEARLSDDQQVPVVAEHVSGASDGARPV